MEDLTQALTPTELASLRAAYDPMLVVRLKVDATSSVYPHLGEWAGAIGDAFFKTDALEPKDRELCLVALLAYRAPGTSLATHVYTALMEGRSTTEICQAVGLAGCYGGLPAYTEGITVVRKTFAVLKRVAAQEQQDCRTILSTLIAELSGVKI